MILRDWKHALCIGSVHGIIDSGESHCWDGWRWRDDRQALLQPIYRTCDQLTEQIPVSSIAVTDLVPLCVSLCIGFRCDSLLYSESREAFTKVLPILSMGPVAVSVVH
jgi:hypothetical protein